MRKYFTAVNSAGCVGCHSTTETGGLWEHFAMNRNDSQRRQVAFAAEHPTPPDNRNAPLSVSTCTSLSTGCWTISKWTSGKARHQHGRHGMPFSGIRPPSVFRRGFCSQTLDCADLHLRIHASQRLLDCFQPECATGMFNCPGVYKI